VPACRLSDIFVSEAHGASSPGDYIEITNCGRSMCSLSGFQLDDSASMSDLTFDASVEIAAGAVWLGYQDAQGSFRSAA
jgi:hypothetical protein